MFSSNSFASHAFAEQKDLYNFVTASGAVSAYAQVETFGNYTGVADGSILSSVTVTANGYKILHFSAQVNATGNVSALPNATFSCSASVDTTATISSVPNAIWSAGGAVTTESLITAQGYKLGEEWTDSPVGNDTWLRQG